MIKSPKGKGYVRQKVFKKKRKAGTWETNPGWISSAERRCKKIPKEVKLAKDHGWSAAGSKKSQ